MMQLIKLYNLFLLTTAVGVSAFYYDDYSSIIARDAAPEALADLFEENYLTWVHLNLST